MTLFPVNFELHILIPQCVRCADYSFPFIQSFKKTFSGTELAKAYSRSDFISWPPKFGRSEKHPRFFAKGITKTEIKLFLSFHIPSHSHSYRHESYVAATVENISRYQAV